MTDIEAILETLRGTVMTLLCNYKFWLGYVPVIEDSDEEATKEEVDEFRAMFLDHILLICEGYNDIASHLGRKIPTSFDETFISCYGSLERRNNRVEKGLAGLQESVSTRGSIVDDKAEEHLENIKGVGEAIATILEYFGKDCDEEKVTEQQQQTLPIIDPPRPFCRAAGVYQLQHANAIYKSAELKAATSGRQGWGYQCHVCGLEVGDYSALRISNDGKCFISSNLLAASHLEKFPSLKDQRAFYRCLVCWKGRKVMDFPNAVAYEQHIRQHLQLDLPTKEV